MLPLRVKLEYSRYFLSERKKYVKNSSQLFKSYKKSVTIFASNPNHPSLNIEKLRNVKGVYTIRLSKGDRIFFIWKEENTVVFIDIGKHDKYRRY